MEERKKAIAKVRVRGDGRKKESDCKGQVLARIRAQPEHRHPAGRLQGVHGERLCRGQCAHGCILPEIVRRKSLARCEA